MSGEQECIIIPVGGCAPERTAADGGERQRPAQAPGAIAGAGAIAESEAGLEIPYARQHIQRNPIVADTRSSGPAETFRRTANVAAARRIGRRLTIDR